jgi:hypothetical protein
VVARQFLFPLRFKLNAQHVIVESDKRRLPCQHLRKRACYGIAKDPASPFKRTIGSP